MAHIKYSLSILLAVHKVGQAPATVNFAADIGWDTE